MGSWAGLTKVAAGSCEIGPPKRAKPTASRKKDTAASAHTKTARDLFVRVKTVDEKIDDIKRPPLPSRLGEGRPAHKDIGPYIR